MVMVSVKDGTSIQKVIKKVILNKLFTVICILPGVDSSEDLSSSDPSPTEKTGIVIGTIVGILTLIIACCTFYHQFYKTKSTVNHGGNPGNNYGDNYGGNNNISCCNDRTIYCNNMCNKCVTSPTTINQTQTCWLIYSYSLNKLIPTFIMEPILTVQKDVIVRLSRHLQNNNKSGTPKTSYMLWLL